ncbi:hypothetical protein [Colwellia sp. PAMC 21821]|uniref:hypothetical protein n=1 Tax=Colwellia sp. PAMC 21821 TaxID=1816219 RepID=UPI0009BEFA5B|nr:hypothetical protein [Colwellia sp. PAMC 21821]ARD45126.1 hypothetical protein A3Q33_12895 [Colwellia sp. PAMC 21821]
MNKIVKFRSGWNTTTRGGKIHLQLSNAETTELDFVNPAEFNSILIILSSSEQAFIDEHGTIWSDAETVDGD